MSKRSTQLINDTNAMMNLVNELNKTIDSLITVHNEELTETDVNLLEACETTLAVLTHNF